MGSSDDANRQLRLPEIPGWVMALAVIVLASVIGYPFFLYTMCLIEVPSKHIAVLTKKTGQNLANEQELAPGPEYKGLQSEVLAEGRHYRNPWNWDWDIVPQVEIPDDKLGVRIRLFGDDPPYGQLIAAKETEKGIVPTPLGPGRYPINAIVAEGNPTDRKNYAEIVELHEPIVVPGGFKGVVTNLAGPIPDDPNVLLVPKGFRGVQEESATLNAGTYYLNPYLTRVNLVDCRSKRFDLTEGGEMGFPSKDGFWVTLDGVIEFRVIPENAAQLYVTYNESNNDESAQASVEEEIIRKIIVPNARSFCRLRGSNHSGKEFISGDTRTKFQLDFQAEMERTCRTQGVQIIQALITRIYPPQKIAEPVRARQIAAQEEQQYAKEILQQKSERDLANQQQMIKRKQILVEAERDVVKRVTAATQAQEVALIQAQQQLAVAELELKAATDTAAAITQRGRAAADVIRLNNAAEAAGWLQSVAAFSQDGNAYARWVLLKKMAPAYRQMMINTADSPIMNIFRQFDAHSDAHESFSPATSTPTTDTTATPQDNGPTTAAPVTTE